MSVCAGCTSTLLVYVVESGEEEAADNGVDETSIEEEEGRGTEREDEGPGQYEPMEEEFEKDEEEEDNEVESWQLSVGSVTIWWV